MSRGSAIRILPPEEAKKIAAGEVIDRPAALVRELMDNAIDSGAANIEVSIEEGGIKKVEVADDGCGMGKGDLSICILPHATSKIQALEDLQTLTSLGFRGEALAAAAAVARVEIITCTGGREAWRLETKSPENIDLSPARRTLGSTVRVYGLFDAIPARKRFLKREASEASLCRQVFLEKAMAFPETSFRFLQDGLLKLHLLPCGETGSLGKRFGELILDAPERAFLHTAGSAGKGFNVTVVFGGPELFRRDRKQQYIFANKRRIQDYGLMQALEAGLAGFFPNGTHPIGAVFIEADPALADFNIHPAKREARFADPGAIHHGISSALAGYTHHHAHNHAPASTSAYTHTSTQQGLYGGPGNSLAMKALLDRRGDFAPLPQKTMADITGLFTAETEPLYRADTQEGGQISDGKTIRLAGRVFGLFIVAERGETLYLIDQHAAHEKLLYDRFLSGPVTTQELLVPIPFSTGSAGEDSFLLAEKGQLARLGIVLENGGGASWVIKALPAGWKKTDSETVESILALHKTKGSIAESWAATLACHTAIRDGAYLDDGAALALAEAALSLAGEGGPLPRCPHGRPLWTEITREDLYRAVRRRE